MRVWIGHGCPPNPSCAVALPAINLTSIEYRDKEVCSLYALGVTILCVLLCSIHSPLEAGRADVRMALSGERRGISLSLDRINGGVIQTVIHIKCFQREGWKKVGYFIKSLDIFLSQRYIRIHKPSG